MVDNVIICGIFFRKFKVNEIIGDNRNIKVNFLELCGKGWFIICIY